MTTEEILALRYHVAAEEYDRGLPGRWSEREPDCWDVRPDYQKASIRFASEFRRKLRHLSGDWQGFGRAVERMGRYPYSKQVDLLARHFPVAPPKTPTDGREIENMRPEEAAEGRRLLDAAPDHQTDEMLTWLYRNRRELVRCAELASVPVKSERERIRDFYCNKAAREAGQPEPFPDPRLAHALANPPGPRHAVVREALASARLDGETHCVELELPRPLEERVASSDDGERPEKRPPTKL